MLKATVCSTPKAQPRSKPPTREEAIARAVIYRSRLTDAEGTATRQREQLIDSRKQIREAQQERDDAQRQVSAERERRVETEKLLFCERRRKRPRIDEHSDNSLRKELKRLLLTCHPDHAKDQTFTSHELTAAINGLLSGEPAERCLPKV